MSVGNCCANSAPHGSQIPIPAKATKKETPSVSGDHMNGVLDCNAINCLKITGTIIRIIKWMLIILRINARVIFSRSNNLKTPISSLDIIVHFKVLKKRKKEVAYVTWIYVPNFTYKAMPSLSSSWNSSSLPRSIVERDKTLLRPSISWWVSSSKLF